jgi:hypothetical protein
VFHLFDGQRRVAVRISTAVGDIDAAVAEQLLEQQ